MENNIFLPKKIRVGFQKRKDTYSGKLAYVIYYDEKGKIRKETSWESWRDKKINPEEFDNEPMSGFVLNKKVGGNTWGWNPRQTYTRVYDPRGFEFEITVPNLLYILENCNSIKGKGLEGEFVYGWSGTELLLIPVGAPDYKNHKAFSEGLLGERIGIKDLIAGATYKFSNGNVYIYLGRFPEYENNKYLGGIVKSKNNFYFCSADSLGEEDRKKHYSKELYAVQTWKSLPKIAQCLSDQPHAEYANLMDLLETDPRYMCPQQYTIEKEFYSFEDFKKLVIEKIKENSNGHYYNLDLQIVSENLKDHSIRLTSYTYRQTSSISDIENVLQGRNFRTWEDYYKEYTLKELFDNLKPVKVKQIKKLSKGELTNA